MIRNNTPEENDFQLAIQDAFERFDHTISFATMVDVNLAWLINNLSDHAPHITKDVLLKIVAQTWDEIKRHGG